MDHNYLTVFVPSQAAQVVSRPVVTLERSAPPLPAIRRRAAIHTMPEVRWAAASLALFALGGAAHLAGLPAPVWWTLYLACYAAGGWEPGAGRAAGAARDRPSTSTC